MSANDPLTDEEVKHEKGVRRDARRARATFIEGRGEARRDADRERPPAGQEEVVRTSSRSSSPESVPTIARRCTPIPGHRKTKPADPEHYREYGTAHRRLRKQWASTVARGNVECSRCGEPIDPNGPWDLDHVDGGGPMDYHGPSHARCNRATNRREADLPLGRTSRIW